MTPLFEQLFHLCIEKRWSFCAFSTPGNSDFEMIIEDVNQTYKSDVGMNFDDQDLYFRVILLYN